MESYTVVVLLLAATIRVATPLWLAALGGLFCERSGVIDLGLEGKMLSAAFAAAAASAVTGSAWAGLGAGLAASVALAMLNALASVTYRGNQVVASMAINIVGTLMVIVPRCSANRASCFAGSKLMSGISLQPEASQRRTAPRQPAT